MANQQPNAVTRPQSDLLPALTGIRFFAVFHIFLFHLWTLFNMEKEGDFTNMLMEIGDLPPSLIAFFSNGWMSTSFFFILSGFILSYLYWGEDGKLVGSSKRFWFLRLSRLYPIHFITLALTVVPLMGYHLQMGTKISTLVPSLLGTVALLQAWVPSWVPMWSWPTWTISALIFLYLVMPWLMRSLSKLSLKQQKILLFSLPLISLIPTIIYAQFFPSGSEPVQHWQIFLGSNPLFWVPQFVAGMLLSRVFGIVRYNTNWKPAQPSWFAIGDIALLGAIALALYPDIQEPFKYFLRHGLMLPLFMLVILDLARGKGLAARLFALPGTGYLGNTAFAIFIWQNLVMTFCWIATQAHASFASQLFIVSCIGIVIIAITSTYLIERPLARVLRRKYLGS
ncbi:acyltransferase family protein [Teredinibacter waterburyi]|uniref:acyltransferase family protein n=1 Tax=Teredinibacter waterburyi TaxID=1500538 RepID=UPI00165EDC3F|nr:acyltransferase [Teredinibacter waterburyi]